MLKNDLSIKTFFRENAEQTGSAQTRGMEQIAAAPVLSIIIVSGINATFMPMKRRVFYAANFIGPAMHRFENRNHRAEQQHPGLQIKFYNIQPVMIFRFAIELADSEMMDTVGPKTGKPRWPGKLWQHVTFCNSDIFRNNFI